MGANEVTCKDKEMAGPSEAVTGAEHCSSSSRSSSSKEMVYSVGHRRASATSLITYMSSAAYRPARCPARGDARVNVVR